MLLIVVNSNETVNIVFIETVFELG